MSTIRIAVSGTRAIDDRAWIYQILDARSAAHLSAGRGPLFHLGDATGVDAIALQWCREREFSRVVFFADRKGYEFARSAAAMRSWTADQEQLILASDWDADNRAAGPIRNFAMIAGIDRDGFRAERCDELLALWDGSSPGTRNARATARNRRIVCYTYLYPLVDPGTLNEPTLYLNDTPKR
jgi:hypothetical protein